MRNKIFLLVVSAILLIGFSNCQMRYEKGTHYKPWKRSGKFSKRWGRERHQNVRRMYWGPHRYGMRPHPSRGHFRGN
ncbi:MAG: hypothetical protein K0Q79_78 [Flavipsychrobacter sp.]|jgi:hypothetical protein|nr:hypothetical protein [Flavipsychrobacter sp.]